jgi:hypothetical protein
MSHYVFDPQVSGVQEDRSGDGRQRSALVRGELVKVDFLNGRYFSQPGSAGGASQSFQSSGFPFDADGGTSALLCICGTGSINNTFSGFTFNFYGSVLGLRIRRDFNTAPRISVVIDGEAFNVPQTKQRFWDMPRGFLDGEAHILIADDLRDDIVHTCQVYVVPDGVSALRADILGYLVERRAGYQESTRLGIRLAVVAQLTAAFATPSLGPTSDTAIRAIRQIVYSNITAGAITVTIADSTGTNIIWQQSIAANSTATFDPGVPIANDIQHKASAVTSINATIFGVY